MWEQKDVLRSKAKRAWRQRIVGAGGCPAAAARWQSDSSRRGPGSEIAKLSYLVGYK